MILALETSAEPASIALSHGGEILSRTFPNKNQVNIPLADELKELLSGHNDPLDCILVGAGPGSYSGARVGLATAEAISLTHDCPVITLPSFHGIPLPASAEKVALIGDARRNAFFIIREHGNEEKSHLQVLEKEVFIAEISSLTESHTLLTFESPDKLSFLKEEGLSPEITHVTSSAEQLITYWNSLSVASQETLKKNPKEVLYLRPPNITKAKNPFA